MERTQESLTPSLTIIMAKESTITESPATSTGTNPIGLSLRNSKHRSKAKE